MSLLDWDPARTAVLAMDCQNDICHPQGAFTGPIAEQVASSAVLSRIAAVLHAARQAGLEVIHVRHIADGFPPNPDRENRMFRGMRAANALVDETWGAAIMDEVAPIEGELIIDKHRISAFAGTSLGTILNQRGIDNLLLSGITTSFVVEGTARDAVDRGYRAGIVSDACVSLSADSHERSLQEVLAFLVDITDVTTMTEWIRGFDRGLKHDD